MAYDPSETYNKYAGSGSGEDCGCSGSSNSNCGCCPPGLVDVAGQGCLTPNDANEYLSNKPCDMGYVMLYDKSQSPPVKLGCVSQDQFDALYQTVNPA